VEEDWDDVSRPVATFDLMVRAPAEPKEGLFRFDWSDIPLDESLGPPLPPGRPVRATNLLCF